MLSPSGSRLTAGNVSPIQTRPRRDNVRPSYTRVCVRARARACVPLCPSPDTVAESFLTLLFFPSLSPPPLRLPSSEEWFNQGQSAR